MVLIIDMRDIASLMRHESHDASRQDHSMEHDGSRNDRCFLSFLKMGCLGVNFKEQTRQSASKEQSPVQLG